MKAFLRSRHSTALQIAAWLLVCLWTTRGEGQFYAGVLGGVSTLSSDARSILAPARTAFSSYGPENGGAVEAFGGKHLSDYFSIQVNYIGNRNQLRLTSAVFNNEMQTGYEEVRTSSQHSAIVDLLVYFRNRDSRFRPFLAVGTGLVHFDSSRQRLDQVLGAPVLPPQRFSSNMIGLHVPVGMDVRLGKGWAFRYTFSETLTKNPVSERLSPSGQHRLMNFQNLFGVVRQF